MNTGTEQPICGRLRGDDWCERVLEVCPSCDGLFCPDCNPACLSASHADPHQPTPPTAEEILADPAGLDAYSVTAHDEPLRRAEAERDALRERVHELEHGQAVVERVPWMADPKVTEIERLEGERDENFRALLAASERIVQLEGTEDMVANRERLRLILARERIELLGYRFADGAHILMYSAEGSQLAAELRSPTFGEMEARLCYALTRAQLLRERAETRASDAEIRRLEGKIAEVRAHAGRLSIELTGKHRALMAERDQLVAATAERSELIDLAESVLSYVSLAPFGMVDSVRERLAELKNGAGEASPPWAGGLREKVNDAVALLRRGVPPGDRTDEPGRIISAVLSVLTECWRCGGKAMIEVEEGEETVWDDCPVCSPKEAA